MLWFDGVLRSCGVCVGSRRAVPSCRTARTSGAGFCRCRRSADQSRRKPNIAPAVLAIRCVLRAAAADHWGPGGPPQPHAPNPAKRAGGPTSEKRGIWSALPSSAALSSGARRAVALLSHRDKLRTAGAPREGPRPQTAGRKSKPQLHQIERRNLRSSAAIINSWRLTQ